MYDVPCLRMNVGFDVDGVLVGGVPRKVSLKDGDGGLPNSDGGVRV